MGLIAVQASAAPENKEAVTLESAAREAVAWHPSVTDAIGRLNQRREDINVAKAGYYPQVRAGFGSSYDNATGISWRPRADISASQMLYDFGKVSSSVDAARAGSKIGRAQLLLSIDGLIRDTAYAVIENLRAAALGQAAADQLASIQGISVLVRQRYERGAATRSDALQAQARVESAETTISQIGAERKRWASNLAYLLGRPTPPDTMSEMPEWLNRACRRGEPDWAEVPTVMAAEAERDRVAAELRRSRAEGLPTVSLGVGAGADVQSPFSGRSDYNFGISLSSSLYNGGATGARARGAGHALAAAGAAAENAENEMRRLLAEGEQQVDNLNEALQALEARQANMEETGKLYRLQYLEMGTRTLVDLLNAEQEHVQARFDAINMIHDLHRLEIDCLYHSGALRDSFGLDGTMIRSVRL